MYKYNKFCTLTKIFIKYVVSAYDCGHFILFCNAIRICQYFRIKPFYWI